MMEAAASCSCLYRAVSVAAAGKASPSPSPSNVTVIIPSHPRRRIVLSQLGPTKKTPKAIPKASPALSPAPTTTSSPLLRGNNKRRKKKKDRDRSLQQQQQQEEEDESLEQCVPTAEEASISVQTLYQNGDPLGRKELGKCVVRWMSQGMRAMASDFASAEIQGEFSEFRQRLGIGVANSTASSTDTGGVAFVIQAQPYLNAIPMPKGLEALCFKACTHYPTLFDHFQRELRDVLQSYQRQSVFPDWGATESWKLLKEFANSVQHRAAVRKVRQAKPVHGGLGMDLEKAKIIQNKIEDFVKHMSDLLHIERDAALEFTQEELNAVSPPDEASDGLKPIEYLVSHGQAQQEQCDTICNLNAISSSTGAIHAGEKQLKEKLRGENICTQGNH